MTRNVKKDYLKIYARNGENLYILYIMCIVKTSFYTAVTAKIIVENFTKFDLILS